MLVKKETTRNCKCRSCNTNIPPRNYAYYLGSFGASNTNIFICEKCVYEFIIQVSQEFESFESFESFLTMQILSK